MKKIAIMFAVAAMMVACGNGAKTATDAQKDSIKNALYEQKLDEAKKALGEAPVFTQELAEDADEATKAAFEEAKALFDAQLQEYNNKLAEVKVDSTTEAFKAEVAEAVKAFEETLNKPAEEKKEGEQPAEGNK